MDNCEALCYLHDNCVSVNFKKDPDSAIGQQECELNNSTHMEHGEDLTTDSAYLFRGAKVIHIKKLIILQYLIIVLSDFENLGKYSLRSMEPKANDCFSITSRDEYR